MLTHRFLQLGNRFLIGRLFVEALLEVVVDGGDFFDRLVGFGIRPFLVFADFEEQFHFGVFRQERAQLRRRLLVVFRDDGGLAARDRREDVDGRIVVLLRELAREDDVSVEDSWDEKAQAKGLDMPVKCNDHCCDALRYLVMRLKNRTELSRAAVNVGYW